MPGDRKMKGAVRLFLGLTAGWLLLSCTVQAQDQPRMPLHRVSVGDTLHLGVPGTFREPSRILRLAFLRSPGFPGSGAFTDAPDSLEVWFRDVLPGGPVWTRVGGTGLDLFTTTVHLDDFDRNGHPDLFVEHVTGGNGAAASGGAIYEIRTGRDDRGIRETLHSDTSVSPIDLDRDGVWEFAVADEFWGLARAHYQATRYWSRIYGPDPATGGYRLVNDQLPEQVFIDLRRPLEERVRLLIRVYGHDPTEEWALELAAAFGEVVAWRITSLDTLALHRYLAEHHDLLNGLIDRLGLPVHDVRGLQQEADATITRIRDGSVRR